MNEPLVVTVLVVLLIGYLVVVRRTRRQLAATRRETAELRSRIEGLSAQMAEQMARLRTHRAPSRWPANRPPDSTSPTAPAEYVITAIGTEPDPGPGPERIDGRLFADIVLREAVVRAASLAHGVRRALAPETRNRIRFEMRREVKRSRKQRRADLKAARRDWEASQRARLDQEEDAQKRRRNETGQMRRGFWFVAGAGAGVYAMVRGRRAAEALTPDGLRDRFSGLAVGARMFRDEVAQGSAEKETELRSRYGLVPHGRPQLENSSTPAPGRPALMDTAEIRRRFVAHFAAAAHTAVPSARCCSTTRTCCSSTPAWCRSSRTSWARRRRRTTAP